MFNELTQRLQSAVKGKAPIVAIPVEGHAPVCLDRKRLAAWSKGVEITSTEVITSENGSHRWLKIEGRSGNVRTKCTMVVIRREVAALEIWKWAEKERKTNLKMIAQGATGAAAIRLAKKEARAKEKATKLAEIDSYHRDSLAIQLRAARETIRVLTPPKDEEFDVAA